jgi:hypothetical protein
MPTQQAVAVSEAVALAQALATRLEAPSAQPRHTMLHQLLLHIRLELVVVQRRQELGLRREDAESDFGGTVQRFDDGAADGDGEGEASG